MSAKEPFKGLKIGKRKLAEGKALADRFSHPKTLGETFSRAALLHASRYTEVVRLTPQDPAHQAFAEAKAVALRNLREGNPEPFYKALVSFGHEMLWGLLSIRFVQAELERDALSLARMDSALRNKGQGKAQTMTPEEAKARHREVDRNAKRYKRQTRR